MITIKDSTGNDLLQVGIGSGSKRTFSLMKEDYVLLKFSLATPVALPVGAYCELDKFGRFELTSLYMPKQNSKGGWDYELQLDAEYYKWKNKILKYNPAAAAAETAWTLTAGLDVQASIIARNLEELGYKFHDSNYIVSIDSSVKSVSKLMSYDSTSILDALYALAEEWECEVWVTENVIHFGRCEFGEAVNFEVGKNCESMTPEGTRETYATRIFAFGSTRNLPTNYRPTDESVVVNGVVQKRLMLPAGNPRIDAKAGMSEEEAVEAVLVFDDIYPRTQCVAGQVNTYQASVEEEDGTTTTKTFYRVSDTSGFIDLFTEDMILEGETLHIKFESGSLNGMQFECALINKDEVLGKCFEVVVNEDYGRELPDQYLHPQEGDKYILLDWDATKIESLGLIASAEAELRVAAEAEVENLKKDPNAYSCKMKSAAMFNDTDYFLYSLGDRVNLINAAYFDGGSRTSRIIGFEYDLAQPFNSPTYTVGEQSQSSRLNTLEKQVNSLTIAGQTYSNSGSGSNIYVIRSSETTPSSDSNVHSAKRSDQRYLRKDANDTARGIITHEQQSIHKQGAQFGQQFVGGLTGVGGLIDGNGHGELDSLSLRSWLEVPELRYNRVSIYIGIRWDTFGGGIIETITPDSTGLETGRGTLKLDAGEIGAIAVGDLCMGIWHDEQGGNETTDTDDKQGNFTFAGFKTVYFEITEVSGSHNENFAYNLRSSLDGGNGVHPYEGMHFAGRGNPDDTSRQAFSYTTTEYSVALVGVNSWEFKPSNYNEIRGNLEGFSMPALDRDGNPYVKVFHGHGQVFGNAYVFGEIDQFERQQFTMEVDQSLNGSLAPNETETVTLTIRNGYGENVTSQFTLVTVTRNTGDAASDALWNATHTNVGNPFTISFSDLGIDGIHQLLAMFHVTATDETTDEQAQQTFDYFS